MSFQNIRVDLICRIPAHHVLDWLLPSGVISDERVYPEDTVLEDYDMLSFRNEAFDISSSQEGVLPGRPGGGLLHGMRCGERMDVRRVR